MVPVTQSVKHPQVLQARVMDFFFFLLFMAAPAAYSISQARGQIRATAAGPPPQPSNARSEPPLQSAPQCTATPDP